MIKDNTFFRFFLSLYLPYFTKNLENYFETVQNNFSRFYFVKESRYMRQVSANEVNNLKYGLLWWPREPIVKFKNKSKMKMKSKI